MLDASTFQDTDLVNLAKENFINLKIDAESDYGQKLFSQFHGAGYPLIIFLDENGLEIDRFYGYLPAYEFMMKMENVISGENTFTYYLDEYKDYFVAKNRASFDLNIRNQIANAFGDSQVGGIIEQGVQLGPTNTDKGKSQEKIRDFF